MKCASSAALVASFKSEGELGRSQIWTTQVTTCPRLWLSASRDNWVSAALCARCMRNSPSAVPSRPWREKYLARTHVVEERGIQRWITLQFLNDWKVSLQTLPSHCCEPPPNSSATPFISWLAASTGITEHWITHPCGSLIIFWHRFNVEVCVCWTGTLQKWSLVDNEGANLDSAAICWSVGEHSETCSAAVLKRERSWHIFAVPSHKQSGRFKITQ